LVAAQGVSTLVDARPGAGCRGLLAVAIPGEGVVQWDARALPASCRWSIAGFAPGSGVLFVGPFEGPGTPSGPNSTSLPPVVRVPVSLWILTDSAGAAEVITVDVMHASQLFEQNRVGVRLEIVEVDTVYGAARDLRADPPLLTDGTWAKKGSEYYADSTINIYVVTEIPLLPGAHGYQSFAASPNSSQPSNLVHIAYRWHQPSTVAHEIGHALQLRGDGCGHPGSGSVGECPCIDARNVMWDVDDPYGARNRFTLGQAFRMSLDSLSWLNRAALRPAAPLLQCQADCWLQGCRLSQPCPCIDLAGAEAAP